MSPKRKDAPTSSDTSTSNTSSTSTSSSSSSASDSSSSESEDNSSSSAAKSGNRSTDSEKRPSKKKALLNTRSNNKVDNVEIEKKDSKPLKPKASQVLYTSDSEDSTSKVNSKRKPQPKPKASATVTPVPKTAKQPLKNPVKKVNPPRRVAQKPVVKDSCKSSVLPKLDDAAKKAKTKSIFSPDNSTDSDDDTSTPPPPKLTAMKTAASKVNTTIKAKPKVKTRNSSVSSNSSDSPITSRSSSVSSPSSRNTTKTVVKKNGNLNVKKEKKIAPPLLTSDRDSDIAPTRKSTRSSNRKSKHVVSRVQSDSDSDTGSKLSATSKSPTKKVTPKGPLCGRKTKGSNTSETSFSIENEERTCPLEGCDSLGHLGGRLEKHFTLEACPIYHNTTSQQCKEALTERLKREEERKKAAYNLKTIQTTQPTPEQKEFRDKVKDIRSKFVPKEDIHSEPDSTKERLPDLSKCSNKYDLKLFQEAQAVACEAVEEELKQLPNVRCTKHIEMGKFEMEVWYQSPYPDDFACLPKLYLCEYCLRYMKYRSSLERHTAKCVWRHPPGEEVYRKDKISVWEVDGKRYKTYCQNLCLLAKFFLDHKTLYYDVEPFLFYVMTIGDNEGCHTVGYFSKEKNSFLNYNVSCILTLPPYQRQGYGRLLIDFSYLLTRVEGKIGSPEKPLSDLGLISYRSYWKDVLLEHLCNLGGKQLSIKDISQDTAINSYDIVSTLQALGMMKYWKGKHIILKKQDVIDEYSERASRRGFTYKEVNPSCLRWTPFVPPDTPSGAS